MNTFAVTYTYAVGEDQLNVIRPTHREWLSGLLAEGILLASGPMVDMPGALLILRADSVEAVAELLDNDPFDVAGFIGERVVTQWNPVFGPWS